jgi:hypothetical protein
MGKHAGNPDPNQASTMLGIEWDRMSPDQKAFEFDESYANPDSYARENFPHEANGGTGGTHRA